MKRIGILYDKESKKVFLLPNEVKALVQKGIQVTISTGLGATLNITDAEYKAAGANICEDWKNVISASDILLKVDAFNKNELKLMSKKIAISMVNYLVNVEMLYYMLTNNVAGLEWCALMNHSSFVFFPELEELKAPYILNRVKDAFAKGLSKKKKDKVVYPKTPKMLIINATFAGIALAKLALSSGFDVIIADDDENYLKDLQKSDEIKNIISKAKTNLSFIAANYDVLVKQVKTCHVLVNTAVSPTDKTMLRITKQMAESMPKGSVLIDAACEFGYSFHFIKKYASDEPEWLKLDKVFYLAPKDMTNALAKQASQIISKKSVDYLIDVAQKGTDNQTIWKITNCVDGKVMNATLNAKLKLY